MTSRYGAHVLHFWFRRFNLNSEWQMKEAQ